MAEEDLSRNFGFLLADVSRLLKTDYDRRVHHTGLTRSQWWVLTHLYRRDGVTQAELADMLEIERPALGRLLDRLESSGWVTREVDPDDRRAKLVYLTDEIQPIMNDMRKSAADLRRDATEGLDTEDVEKLVDLLIAIKGNVTRHLSTSDEDEQSMVRSATGG